jgi:hypothetical protein
MDPITLVQQCIESPIRMLADEYAASVYCMGSFAFPKRWTFGQSDIDLIVLTQNDVFAKADIDITNHIKQELRCYDNTDDTFSVILSYAVWNIEAFCHEVAWSRFYMDKKLPQTTIIEDQLLFSATHKWLYGTKQQAAENIRIQADEYRAYLLQRYNKADQFRPQISLVREIKRIIYACRIYYFLWTGEYIYRTDTLLDKVKNMLSGYAYDILSLAHVRKLEIQNHIELSVMRHSDYFKQTKHIYALRRVLVEELVAQDKVLCDCYVNGNFIDFY